MDLINLLTNDIRKNVIQASNSEQNGVIKKEVVLQMTRGFYDSLDRNFNIPEWIDIAIKYVVLPILIDFTYHSLKSEGIL